MHRTTNNGGQTCRQAGSFILHSVSWAKNKAPSSSTSRAILCGFHTGWGILTSWSLQGILEPVPKTLGFSWYYHKALSVAAEMLRIKAEDTGDFGQQMCLRTGKSTPSKKALQRSCGVITVCIPSPSLLFACLSFPEDRARAGVIQHKPSALTLSTAYLIEQA